MMILKEHNISVRLPQERAIDTGIVFVQNDKDVYKLNVRVFDGDNEIDYSQVENATITFSKADGKVVQGDMQIEADQLTYVLGTNEIAAPGKLLASIQLLGANERLTTARFLFRVEKDLITEDAVKSTSEFAILQQLKQELEEIDVVELTNQFNAHTAESVSDGVHGMGSAASRNAQSSSTDTTPNSLMIVGAFGLGSTSPTRSSQDLNERLRNGWSAVDANTPNAPITGPGSLLTSMWDNIAAGWQLFNPGQPGGSNDLWFRSRGSSTWGKWVRLVHSDIVQGQQEQIDEIVLMLGDALLGGEL